MEWDDPPFECQFEISPDHILSVRRKVNATKRILIIDSIHDFQFFCPLGVFVYVNGCHIPNPLR